MQELLFSLEIYLESLRLLDGVDCGYPFVYLKFLDFESVKVCGLNEEVRQRLLQTHKDLSSELASEQEDKQWMLGQFNSFREADGSYFIRRGKSLLFRMTNDALCACAHSIPLYLIICDSLSAGQNQLVGIVTISIAQLSDEISQELWTHGMGKPCSSETVGSCDILSLMGKNIGAASLKVRLNYLGLSSFMMPMRENKLESQTAPEAIPVPTTGGVAQMDKNMQVSSSKEAWSPSHQKVILIHRQQERQMDGETLHTVREQLLSGTLQEKKCMEDFPGLDKNIITPPNMFYHSDALDPELLEPHVAQEQLWIKTGKVVEKPEKPDSIVMMLKPHRKSTMLKTKEDVKFNCFLKILADRKLGEPVSLLERNAPSPEALQGQEEETLPKKPRSSILDALLEELLALRSSGPARSAETTHSQQNTSKPVSDTEKTKEVVSHRRRPRAVSVGSRSNSRRKSTNSKDHDEFLQRMSTPKSYCITPPPLVPKNKGWIRPKVVRTVKQVEPKDDNTVTPRTPKSTLTLKMRLNQNNPEALKRLEALEAEMQQEQLQNGVGEGWKSNRQATVRTASGHRAVHQQSRTTMTNIDSFNTTQSSYDDSASSLQPRLQRPGGVPALFSGHLQDRTVTSHTSAKDLHDTYSSLGYSEQLGEEENATLFSAMNPQRSKRSPNVSGNQQLQSQHSNFTSKSLSARESRDYSDEEEEEDDEAEETKERAGFSKGNYPPAIKPRRSLTSSSSQEITSILKKPQYRLAESPVKSIEERDSENGYSNSSRSNEKPSWRNDKKSQNGTESNGGRGVRGASDSQAGGAYHADTSEWPTSDESGRNEQNNIADKDWEEEYSSPSSPIQRGFQQGSADYSSRSQSRSIKSAESSERSRSTYSSRHSHPRVANSPGQQETPPAMGKSAVRIRRVGDGRITQGGRLPTVGGSFSSLASSDLNSDAAPGAGANGHGLREPLSGLANKASPGFSVPGIAVADSYNSTGTGMPSMSGISTGDNVVTSIPKNGWSHALQQEDNQDGLGVSWSLDTRATSFTRVTTHVDPGRVGNMNNADSRAYLAGSFNSADATEKSIADENEYSSSLDSNSSPATGYFPSVVQRPLPGRQPNDGRSESVSGSYSQYSSAGDA